MVRAHRVMGHAAGWMHHLATKQKIEGTGKCKEAGTGEEGYPGVSVETSVVANLY